MDPAMQLVTQWLDEQPQDMWLAFVLNTNHDIAVDALRWMIRSGRCDRAVALAMYWALGAGFYVQYADRSEVPAYAQLGFNLIKKIERLFLAGEFPASDLGYDPSRELLVYADVPVVSPVPAALKSPIPGRQIDLASLTAGWENGVPAFIWTELDARGSVRA
ncbi:DUF4274 domain-containing protein [Deinococcus arcticus]|nr:DUF4274 domain-containing protein [Deinococcus arcticus]